MNALLGKDDECKHFKRQRLHLVLNPPLCVCQCSVAFLRQSKSWTAVGKLEVRAGPPGAIWRLKAQ